MFAKVMENLWAFGPWGLRPEPRWGAYTALPNSLTGGKWLVML